MEQDGNVCSEGEKSESKFERIGVGRFQCLDRKVTLGCEASTTEEQRAKHKHSGAGFLGGSTPSPPPPQLNRNWILNLVAF